MVGGELVDEAYVRDLATVPPREELLARIAGGLVGQIRELMALLEATTREFAGPGRGASGTQLEVRRSLPSPSPLPEPDAPEAAAEAAPEAED